MDNKKFLEELKFGVGDGNLQYYLYNWRCPTIQPEKVGQSQLNLHKQTHTTHACVQSCTHTRTHARTRAHTHTHTHCLSAFSSMLIYVCYCTYTIMHARTHARTSHACVQSNARAHAHTHTHTRAHMYSHGHMYVYNHAHTHTSKNTFIRTTVLRFCLNVTCPYLGKYNLNDFVMYCLC